MSVAIRRARQFRRNETKAERKLWNALRGGKLAGLRFRRQHPLGRFTLDFYCEALRLCVEVDGGQHDGRELDIERTSHLNALGIEVVRYWNNEVLENLDGVWTHLKGVVEQRRNQLPSPGPLRGPPSPKGEG